MSECYEVVKKGTMRRRRYNGRRYLLILLLFIMVFTFVFLRNYQKRDTVEAADLTKFDPGYIISDYQMSNYASMTEAEIQDFLKTKNPCNNRDEGAYRELVAKYPNISWHFENGHFICLSEERFGDGEAIGKGETAAHIIWQAAQDYKINPQVIIVLLQKEQGLITDTFPNSRQYRAATGYGCPDTAACSSKYYGFKNQVRNAALMFRSVLNGGWTNYPLGKNYIQYNPNAACGGSVVDVKNLATSSLYRYTPYQPNVAALAVGYGTASCGAYGNRNFYLYFEDWFGGITREGALYVSLESPRYMITKETVERVSSNGEVVDTIEKNTVLKYTTKTVLSDGTVCLRTEFASNSNTDACVPMSALKEVTLKAEKITENNKKVIKAGAKKYYIKGETTFSLFKEPIVRDIVATVVFNKKKYYITEYDYKYSNFEYGFLEEDIEDIPSYEELDNKKAIQLTSDVRRIEPISDEYFDSLHKGRTYEFASYIKMNDKCYYRTLHNTNNDINLGVLESELEKAIFVDFEVPRFLIVGKNAERINPITGEVFDVLKEGSRIKFITKVLINGTWYYRTEHNTNNGLFLVVAADKLKNT